MKNVVVLLVLSATSLACAAGGPATSARNGGVCPIDPERFVTVLPGDAPLVLSSTHAGLARPKGCDASGALKDLPERSCSASLDLACESGPCKGGGPDADARQLTFTLRDDLAQCLGKTPSLALAEVNRAYVDMNRDAHDSGGTRCAMQDVAAEPYWEAYHKALEGLVAQAVFVGGNHALLIDVHTYNSIENAPPPAVQIGTGHPIGLTFPHQMAEDPTLPLLYGDDGLRRRLLHHLKPVAAAVKVLPSSIDADPDGLYVGRYVVLRYSRAVDDETRSAGPVIDSIQIEVSAVLRNDVDATAQGIAAAICEAYGPRLKAPPEPQP